MERAVTANVTSSRRIRAGRDLAVWSLAGFVQDDRHPLKRLIAGGWRQMPEAILFVRAVQDLNKLLVERDAQSTSKQREHFNGRVLRAADAAAAAGRRLSARAPWLAARLYDLTFGVNAPSWRALRRDVEWDLSREALTTLRWALYRGKRHGSATSGSRSMAA